jgi:hypothetical protein
LKRLSLSGAVRVAFAFAKGSAIELIEFMGWGSAPRPARQVPEVVQALVWQVTHPINVIKGNLEWINHF